MRLLNQLLLVFIIVFFYECNPSDNNIDKLLITADNIEFAANEVNELFVEVITNVTSWKASTSVEWINIDQVSDGFYVTVKPYTDTGKDRLGTIIVKAGDANPVPVIVTQYRMGKIPEENVITYDACEGVYFGDISELGTASCMLLLYNFSDIPRTYIYIAAFCTLPDSYADFKLDEGAYFCLDIGDPKTFLSGKPYNESFLGSAVHVNQRTLTLITGGFFTVSLLRNMYTINTYFSGKDSRTGDVVNNIRVKYTGPIPFENLSAETNSH